MARFGLSALVWYESYMSSASFRRVEYVVGCIQPGMDNIREVYGDIKPTILTSFDQLQVASNVYRWRMVELEASVAIVNTHQEAEYREILSLNKAMVCQFEVRHSQPNTIIMKKNWVFWLILVCISACKNILLNFCFRLSGENFSIYLCFVLRY